MLQYHTILHNLYRNVLQGKEIGSTIQSGVSPWVWGGCYPVYLSPNVCFRVVSSIRAWVCQNHKSFFLIMFHSISQSPSSSCKSHLLTQSGQIWVVVKSVWNSAEPRVLLDSHQHCAFENGPIHSFVAGIAILCFCVILFLCFWIWKLTQSFNCNWHQSSLKWISGVDTSASHIFVQFLSFTVLWINPAHSFAFNLHWLPSCKVLTGQSC